jgi:hypothetical protein
MVVILGLTFGFVRYLLPTLGEQASRQARALMQDAAEAQRAIQTIAGNPGSSEAR